MKAATSLLCEATHDCHSDIITGAVETPIYRRTDDPTNQNLYATADTGVATDALLTTRGSPDVYVVGAPEAAVVKSFATATSQFGLSGALATATASTDQLVFVNGHGPYTPTATIGTGADATFDVDATSGGAATLDFLSADFDNAQTAMNLQITKADTKSIAGGSILALNGRRYKVKSVGTTAANGKITLTENFAGGQLLQLCSACFAGIDDHSDAAKSVITIATKKLTITKGDYLLVAGYVNTDLKMTVGAEATTGDHADSQSFVTSYGANKGRPATATAVGAAQGTAAVLTGKTTALYKEINTNNYIGSVVTETIETAPFQYVSQCSSRGTCDATTGICKCFKGYSNDNCDNQNMLAM